MPSLGPRSGEGSRPLTKRCPAVDRGSCAKITVRRQRALSWLRSIWGWGAGSRRPPAKGSPGIASGAGCRCHVWCWCRREDRVRPDRPAPSPSCTTRRPWSWAGPPSTICELRQSPTVRDHQAGLPEDTTSAKEKPRRLWHSWQRIRGCYISPSIKLPSREGSVRSCYLSSERLRRTRLKAASPARPRPTSTRLGGAGTEGGGGLSPPMAAAFATMAGTPARRSRPLSPY
jgi:hypothetical protein